MDDLTAFLTARLGEDEAFWTQVLINYQASRRELESCQGIRLNTEGGVHTHPDITRKALREVAAKRAILALHTSTETGVNLDTGEWETLTYCETCPPFELCEEARILAAVYADHPEYREEWAV